jgi:hypothetical protein
MAISVVFLSSTSVTAFFFTEYLDENIWKWSYETLSTRHATIANSIDPASWPSQNEPDLEQENGDQLPDFSNKSFLIIKWKKNSYVFEDGAPTTWDELNSYGIYGISSYSTPEPSVVIMLCLGLIGLAICKKRIIKS